MKQKNRLKDQIDQYAPCIEAIVTLFHPFVEAAVHDLRTGKIVKLYHTISQRKEGDKSPLHELGIKADQFPDYFTPYYKRNWDGRQLKCTSITIRDQNDKAIGLICFNVDVSVFQDTQRVLQSFLSVEQQAENPVDLFGKGPEQIVEMIESYLHERHLTLNHLSKSQKKELIQFMHHKGIFNFKNAVPLLARSLKLSRASIYNYIKQIGETER
jgi:predicted transcriptional regulator YheO